MPHEREADAFAIVGRGPSRGGIDSRFAGALAGVDGGAKFISAHGADSLAVDGDVCGMVGGALGDAGGRGDAADGGGVSTVFASLSETERRADGRGWAISAPQRHRTFFQVVQSQESHQRESRIGYRVSAFGSQLAGFFSRRGNWSAFFPCRMSIRRKGCAIERC